MSQDSNENLKKSLLSDTKQTEEDDNEINIPELAHSDTQNQEKFNSYSRANIFSKLIFYWVTPLMKLGNKVFLEQEMLDPLRKQDESYNLFQNFDLWWNKYKHVSKSPLYRAIFSSKRGQIFLCLFLQFIVASLDLTKPVLIKILIEYAGSKDKDVQTGLIWLTIMISLTTISSVVSQHTEFQFNILGYCLNNSIVIALYKKSLRISLFSNKDYKQGEIINLAQVDANRLYSLCNQIALIIFLPMQLIVGLWLMYELIGVALIAGLVSIFIIGVMNAVLARFLVKYQKQMMKDKDQRMKVTNEIFNSIKFIKVNAWEEYFFNKLDIKRQKELKTLKKRIFAQIIQVFLSWVTSPLIINSVFAWYTLTDNTLSAEIAFPVITLFNSLQGPIQGIPSMISTIVETNISVKRLQKFLMTEEIDTNYIKFENQTEYRKSKTYDQQQKRYAVTLKSGTFNWGKDLLSEENQKKADKEQKKEKKKKEKELKKQQKKEKKLKKREYLEIGREDMQKGGINYKDSDVSSMTESIRDTSTIQDSKINSEQEQNFKPILNNLNIQIEQGKMVAIVGDVGSGKSSFLYSLIGEMKYNKQDQEYLQPKLEIKGDIALVNQKPWIQSDTIQNNIIFGLELDEEKYAKTIKYASLVHDFTVLDNGDQTMVGEQGINLSGGQKARIALARAIYSDADILLLDDVLSAVDVHVGKHIVQECLMKYKKDTTRILITHALHYMKYMDYIYLLDEGSVVLEGNYDQLRDSDKFQEIYEKFMKDQYTDEKELEDEETYEKEEQQLEEQLQKLLPVLKKQHSSKKSFNKSTPLKKRKSSNVSENNKDNEDTNKEAKSKYDNLIIEEDRKKGEIGLSVYWEYAKYNGGVFYVIIVLFGGLFTQIMRIWSSLWITYWTQATEEDDYDEDENNYFMLIFAILSISVSLGTVLRISTVLLCNFKTVTKLHRQMITNLLYAPMNEFYDRVPLGRITNRLSKDMNVMDTQISFAVGAFIVGLLGTIGTIFLCVYASSPWVLLPIIIYFFICYKVYAFYITANREIVRLESITKSPVVSYFSETLNGLHSIRAYNKQEMFINKQCTFVNENKKNQISMLASNIWFRMTLSLCSIMINISSISFCLFTTSNDASTTGLLLTYTLNIDLIIRWMIMNFGWLEQRLVSFERCIGFLEIDCEKGYQSFIEKRDELVSKKLPLHNKNEELTNWPHEGVVEFIDVQAKYREGLCTVLKGLSFTVNKEEKIGIVGRTGAGKSTITLCLLRIIELYAGQIKIDGVDISQLSLDDLRSKITIILQDPQLFEGTIRDNIDPLKEHTDQQIIDTLNKCNLSKLCDDRDGLNSEIQEGGGNLSIGEKQLLCIARALLKKSKLVLIDEATANIDIQTEHLVQKTIQSVFKECTVLTIAHRINTILQSDRILVLDSGKVSEFDTPKNLLQNQNSLFFKLHEEATKENII